MADYTVLYTSAHNMLLRAARADGSHDRKLLRYISRDLLIIDDLGLRSLEHDEPIDLYEIIRRRYEQGSMIIASNRAVEEWPRSSAMRSWPAPRWTACSTTPT